MKVAPDVEQMMWMVAESADPNAIEDFGARFPHLRFELSKRIDMVRKLKASGKMAKPDGSIPRFIPPARLGSPIGSRFRWGFAAIALSALAVGSFFGTKYFAAKTPEMVKERPLPKIEYTQPKPNYENTAVPEQEPDVPPLKESGVIPPDDEPNLGQKWEQLQAVKFEKVGLATAIKAICQQSGIKLDMPQDMPNDEIVVDYQGMTGLAMLQDMASRFGFTVFAQGDGKVLVIPARQEGSGAGSNGSTKTTPIQLADPAKSHSG